MLGDYVLHHPITDFPVALLVIAALFQITCLVLKRPQWQVIADATLVVGFVGSLAAVGTGLWLAGSTGLSRVSKFDGRANNVPFVPPTPGRNCSGHVGRQPVAVSGFGENQPAN